MLIFNSIFTPLQKHIKSTKEHIQNTQKEMLYLQNLSKQNKSFNLTALEQKIASIKREITQQNAQIALQNQRLGLYYITQIANKNQLQNIQVHKQNTNAFLSTSGNYSNLFSFLKELKRHPFFHIDSMVIYPNLHTLNLETFITIVSPKREE